MCRSIYQNIKHDSIWGGFSWRLNDGSCCNLIVMGHQQRLVSSASGTGSEGHRTFMQWHLTGGLGAGLAVL